MSKQGTPVGHRPEDGWWDTVYEGPAGALRDIPDTPAGEGTVDDWFDTAAGLIGRQRAAGPEAAGGGDAAGDTAGVSGVDAAPGAPVAEQGLLERDSIDDWFDTAVGVIAPQRTREPAGEPDGAPDPELIDEPAGTPAAEPDHTRKFEAPGWAARAEEQAAPAAPVEPVEPEAAVEPAPMPEAAAPAPVAQAAPEAPAPAAPPAHRPAAVRPPVPAPVSTSTPAMPHVGERPPTYGPEPTTVPEADPASLGGAVPDTVLEGAQYGAATLRAASVRGDSARYRGEPRRDALLVTRFGDGPDGLLLAALAGYDRTAEGTADAPAPAAVATAAAESCRQLAAAIGRSRAELAADLRDGARDRLRYGLQRLATGAAAPLRALAPAGPEDPDGGSAPEAASLHCLLLSLDPAAGHRAAFGVGPGGLYLLRSGHWIDAYAARLLHHPDGQPPLPGTPVPEPRPFRFRLVPATPGDVLLLCTPGLADPVADEPAVARFLADHWAHPHPPGTVDFLRQVQVRAKGYADDRTAAALWTE
ncbi:protein phosphatase 2C domain-containing protein [Kitasatospora sp. NPDC054939]